VLLRHNPVLLFEFIELTAIVVLIRKIVKTFFLLLFLVFWENESKNKKKKAL
jgi:hypothetical protein